MRYVVCYFSQYVNPAYERLTGYSMEEVVGKDSRELKGERVKPDVQDGVNNQIKKGKVSSP
jgi:PAS domain S-box-containing protein